MLRFAQVRLGEGGVIACRRCSPTPVQAVPRALDEVLADLRHAVEGWDGGPGPNVSFFGIDPFSHPDLPALVTASVEAGVARLRLVTTAGALTEPGNADGAIAAGVRHVRVPLLGGEETHDALCGTQGALDDSLAGIRAFADAAAARRIDVCLTAEVPVCRHNLQDLPGAVTLAAQAGASEVTLRLDDGALDLRRAAVWLAAACDSGTVNGAWVDLAGVPFCAVPGYDLHVAAGEHTVGPTEAPACSRCAVRPHCPTAPAEASAAFTGVLDRTKVPERLLGMLERGRRR